MYCIIDFLIFRFGVRLMEGLLPANRLKIMLHLGTNVNLNLDPNYASMSPTRRRGSFERDH